MKMKKKTKDLWIIFGIYLISYIIGYLICMSFANIIFKFFVFDIAATIVTFIFSVLLKNSSVYDAYWSLTPMIMSIWLFVLLRAVSPMQILFLIVFNLWSIRLTMNWVIVFTDFSYEDWRYRKFRNELSKVMWPMANFFGIHMVPTIVVFLGMLPLFQIAQAELNFMVLPGMLVILIGVALEYFADRQMHDFLNSGSKGSVCRNGLWKYSRHPNYLGEMTVWLGVYLVMLPYACEKYYYMIGFLSIVFLFNVVSISMMEKRQLARRPEYADYKKTTSRLLLRIR